MINQSFTSYLTSSSRQSTNNSMTDWKMKLPMWITMSRIAMVPAIILCLIPQELNLNIFAAALFIIASISDYYDGYFARKYNAISTMGKFMDPIADKILVTSILVMLTPAKIDPFMVILILARDTFIGGIRSVAAADHVIIAAKSTGKWKTALQMIAIPAVMIGDLGSIPLEKVGYALLWISVFLSILSGIEYYSDYLKSRKQPNP